MAVVPPLLWLDGRGVGVVPPLLHISYEDTGRRGGGQNDSAMESSHRHTAGSTWTSALHMLAT